MMLLLPFTCFLLLVLLLRKREDGWRAAVLGAAVLWTVFLTGVTEVLSVFRLVTFGALGAAWLGACLAAGVAYVLTPSKTVAGKGPEAGRLPLTAAWSLAASIVLVVLPVGVTALVAPPNTWDSLNYHMTRLLYWMQNQSVAHYPTAELRQLYMQPGSEFILLQK